LKKRWCSLLLEWSPYSPMGPSRGPVMCQITILLAKHRLTIGFSRSSICVAVLIFCSRARMSILSASRMFVLMAGNLSDQVDMKSKEAQKFRQPIGPGKYDAFISKYSWLDEGRYASPAFPLPAICHQRRRPHACARRRAQILRSASCLKSRSPSRPNRFPVERLHLRAPTPPPPPGFRNLSDLPSPRIGFRIHDGVDSPHSQPERFRHLRFRQIALNHAVRQELRSASPV
jgi:hypothetical protein